MASENPTQKKKKKSVWNVLGPGLVTGAADDDPSGIATYSQAGASFGFTYLWLSIFTFPLMAFVQEMCARIALVTGRGLAANIRSHFSRKVLIFATLLLLVANTFNIGADLSAMAEVSNLILPNIPAWFFVLLLGVGSMLLEVFVIYKKYSSYLKWLTLVLVSYILAGFVINFDFVEVLRGAFIPNMDFDKKSLFLITAILGTTISPYLFFWQTSQEIEEEIGDGDHTLKQRVEDGPKRISNMRVDVWVGMFFSNLVMFFIIAVCAETLFKNGITDIQTAAEAASALKPIAGHFAYLLFAIGVLGTGLLALPVLAGSSAYALSEAFGWKEGLYRKPRSAKAFYSVIIFSMIMGILIPFIGLSPIKSLLYSAMLNGLIAPIMIVFIVILSSSKMIMGVKVNNLFGVLVGWGTVLLMGTVGIFTLWNIFLG